MKVTIDAADAVRVFRTYPAASTRELNGLIRAGAIDVQREMRINAPVHDGQLRRSIIFKTSPANMSAEIWPDVNYAEPVEKGTKPHWTSVREGTPLRKWADDHGINPYALQHSIAKKGTKPTRFVRKTFDSAKRRVEDDIVRGFSRFVTAVDEGKI